MRRAPLPAGLGERWPEPERRKVTILLLSVDEAATLAHSLPAAMAQRPAAEVVVLDNASTDDTGRLAAAHGAGYRRLSARVSYAKAINLGLEQVDSDAVLLLNADCFLDPGALAAMLRRLGGPAVGSVAPKLRRAELDATGTPRASTGELDAAGMFLDRRRKNGLVGHGRPVTGYGSSGEVFGADGAAALYRRETLEDCRLPDGELLDEDMALWASDADLAWRARLRGWRSVFEPSAGALHLRTYSPSTRAELNRAATRLQFRNRLLMMVKNETWDGVRRDGLHIAAYELLALGHVLLRERHLLAGYREAWELLPAARRRRRSVQGLRRADRVPFGLRPGE